MVLDIGASGAERIADFAVVHLSEVGKKDDLSFCSGKGHERIIYALIAHNEMQTVFHDIPFELEIPVCRDELVQLFSDISPKSCSRFSLRLRWSYASLASFLRITLQ